MPPPFVRRMGCAFGALILSAAIGASTLVSMLLRAPQRALATVAIGIFVSIAVIAGFAFAIGRVGRAFREQNRLRRQLMADVAHELRTPLAILQGRIEGLLDGIYERDDERLGELLDETRHLSRLVDDLRTLANAEAGALELRKETVDLAELIRDTAASLSGTIVVNVPAELPIVIDPMRIREVLLNLLSNALRATPPDGRVAIDATDDDANVTIRVKDNGSGIPADQLSSIFDRFRKGGDSTGSGLGLAIARKLVVAHDGDIRIESVEGKGTTVTVSLPR
ncbi:MAG: two-component system, OmpR family, sensor kinase [Acidobacteriota bacterium]|jgi:signal transduction histidine kinase|nr:two-component system, OmpR family, sensor kinase [Acidobacteriota bacterium]